MPYIETTTEYGDKARKFVSHSQFAHYNFSKLLESVKRANESAAYFKAIPNRECDEVFASDDPSNKELLLRDFDREEARSINGGV